MSQPFRRRSALVSWELQYGPNMTPMVDVVMVILIFFMASASFVGSEWFLKTAIPKQGAPEAPKGDASDPFKLPPARFELTLARGPGGRTVVAGPGFADLAIDGLAARLRELASGAGPDDLVLVIRPETGVPYGDVIRAHDAAAAAGIAKVGLMDAPPPGEPAPPR